VIRMIQSNLTDRSASLAERPTGALNAKSLDFGVSNRDQRGSPVAQTTARAFIKIDAVTHRFDDGNVALGDVRLEIPHGQFVCLLGPSGCGKTTLLNLVAGFLTPSEGGVFLDGKYVDAPGPDRGMVFQDYSLFPWRTVQKNVEFGLEVAKMNKHDRKATAKRYLDLVNLGHVASRFPTQLSGGMKQRVAIARALAPGPRVLLMDEPFAALDAMTRNLLQNELIRIHELEKCTTLFVTHNIDEAIRLADRVLIMSANPGRVADDVTLESPKPRSRTSSEFARLYDQFERQIEGRGS
jgi:NitT/TauT family transport system ATP-binding protein